MNLPHVEPYAAAAAPHRLLPTVDEAYRRMLAAIERAGRSVRLEMYIYTATPIGERFRDALVRAAGRGVRVRVLLDSFGSMLLPESFWDPLTSAGGEHRWFNPVTLQRFAFRNHRKSLVCDDTVAYVGGFNVAAEYAGDGVERGWHDLGLEVHGALAADVGAAFDELFERAGVPHSRLVRLRKTNSKRRVDAPEGRLFLSGPGRGRNVLRSALLQDLSAADDVDIASAYFLPPRVLRRALRKTARAGKRVVLLMAGKSDVPVSQLATRMLYASLLRAGIEIYEYQPQILHTKLFRFGDVVYVGSANMNLRSLHIDYELMIRIEDRQVAEQARGLIRAALDRSQVIEAHRWRSERSLATKVLEQLSYLLLARIDPLVAGRQIKALRGQERLASRACAPSPHA